MDELRQFLLDNPEICHSILDGSISLSQGGDIVSRVLGQYQKNGFKVTVKVNDDDLTPEERRQRDAELADRAIRVLMTDWGKRG